MSQVLIKLARHTNKTQNTKHKTQIMKNSIKSILVLTLAVTALTSKADYTLTTGPAATVPATQRAGLGGKSTFTLTFAGGTFSSTTLQNKALNPSALSSQYDFFYTQPAAGNAFKNSYFQIYADAGIFSSVTIDPSSTLNLGNGNNYSAGPYTLVVNWTLNALDNVGDTGDITFNFIAKSPDTLNTQVSPTSTVTVAAVPEPGQALAGAVLLGCGALVFTGRRWMKAQAAK